MRAKGAWSESTYRSTEAKVASVGRGSATFVAEQRVGEGKGLDPLVDPKGLPKYGPVRGAGNLLVPEGDIFILKYGVAMPVQTDIDTTGSMGDNVNIAFGVQPMVQKMLIQGTNAVLKRYQAQMCTSAIQDEYDKYAYMRTQFEPDNEVERQMGLLYPERAGGDTPEEYQIGLFAAAYLTDASITKYGLRGYYFPVGDVWGRNILNEKLLKRVFGPKVLELAFGGKIPQSLPTTREVCKKLLENWHGFFLQVGDHRETRSWWNDMLGEERIVKLPRTEDLASVQAVIIGLTEGVLDMKTSIDFLKELNVQTSRAKLIVEACAGIPTGLQATLPNFNKIPLAGAKFASNKDIWPIDATVSKIKKTKKDEPVAKKKKASWKI